MTHHSNGIGLGPIEIISNSKWTAIIHHDGTINPLSTSIIFIINAMVIGTPGTFG